MTKQKIARIRNYALISPSTLTIKEAVSIQKPYTGAVSLLNTHANTLEPIAIYVVYQNNSQHLKLTFRAVF